MLILTVVVVVIIIIIIIIILLLLLLLLRDFYFCSRHPSVVRGLSYILKLSELICRSFGLIYLTNILQVQMDELEEHKIETWRGRVKKKH